MRLERRVEDAVHLSPNRKIRAGWAHLLRSAQHMRSFGAVAVCVVALASFGCATRDAVGKATGENAAQTRLTEKDLEQLMQKIVQGNQTDNVAKTAQQLGDLFGGVEKFWTQHNRADAVKFAQQARAYASETAGAAAAGDAAKASAAAGNIGGACKQCHGTYRESDGQGGYRIKPGVLQ
jgi:cytochrome c556